MPPISRGFSGRPRRDVDPSRVPPGQYVVEDFPVLSAGPTPRTPLDEWSLTIDGAVDAAAHLDAGSSCARCRRDVHDRHPLRDEVDEARHDVDRRLARHAAREVETEAEYLTAWCDGDYTTNLTIEDVTDGRPGSPTTSRASRSTPSTAARPGCSCRTCTSGRARSGCAASRFTARGRAGLLGGRRLPQPRRPVAGAAVLERLTVARAPVVWHSRGARGASRRPPRPRRSCSTSTAGPATSPASTSTCA